MNSKIKIGLFGFGTVGQGLYHVLKESKGHDAQIKKICVKNKDKQRSISKELFTYNTDEIINDAEINLVVELIDDADAAYQIVKSSLMNGKNVVSANKKMLAYHLKELIELQHKNNVSLLYEASSCGSIPVLRNLEEYYDNDLLLSVSGILNGSSNYILSKIFNEKLDYTTALKQAQELGYAESEPLLDVGGFDSLYKLIIITIHSFGVIVNPDNVLNYGIQNISEHDINYAREKGYKIKLVAQVNKINERKISLFVLPKFVKPDEYIYNVEYQFNGVVIEGLFYDKQFMFGKGAGGNPTGSAVLSDITATTHDYKYEYKKMKYYGGFSYTTDAAIEIYIRYYNERDLNHFHLDYVSERYVGRDFSYIIGKIRIDKLLHIKELLPKLDIFLAYTGAEFNI
ncbi:MAG: homoserine dehydrogenase [Bacteroidales bacterium]|jgi:homoserine dehydrogenase